MLISFYMFQIDFMRVAPQENNVGDTAEDRPPEISECGRNVFNIAFEIMFFDSLQRSHCFARSLTVAIGSLS